MEGGPRRGAPDQAPPGPGTRATAPADHSTAPVASTVPLTSRGHHVGLLLPPSAGFVASFYGTLLAGKGVVPINFLLGDREIAHIIKDSGVDTVVSIPQLAGRLERGGRGLLRLPAAGAYLSFFTAFSFRGTSCSFRCVASIFCTYGRSTTSIV